MIQVENLLEIEMLYTTSPANEDLLSFDSHNENAEDIGEQMGYCEEELAEYPDVIELPAYNHRPKAVACATAREHVNAYLLMCASGCKTVLLFRLYLSSCIATSLLTMTPSSMSGYLM